MFVEQRKMVPPDGGWGWIVVIGVSVVNLCTRAIEPSFGLLFGELLYDLKVGTTGAAVIMSTLDALINFSGLFVGPLIRAFSYRKVALVGSFLCGLGLILTYPARSMAHILATYSIINGLGVGLTASSTFVALNHFFLKRRGQAVGFSLAGTAFGMMIMPQAIKFLLDEYGFRGAILVLGSFALNSLVGSSLMEPAERYYVPEVEDEEEVPTHVKEMETIKETDNEDADAHENETLIGSDPSMMRTMDELSKPPMGLGSRKSTFPRNFSTISFLGNRDSTRKRKVSSSSIMSSYSRLDFTGSSIQLHLDRDNEVHVSAHNLRRNMSYPGVQLSPEHKVLKEIQVGIKKLDVKTNKTVWQRVVEFMDFDLLKDPVYLNLVFGLSIAYVAEQNFKMVTPFFFQKINYSRTDIAFFLSVQALTDILARLILPPICDRLTISKRTLFMIGIFILGICRSVLAEQRDYTMIMIWLVICGFFRGAALINFTITISEYSSLEKLPAAFGLHMVGKGLFVVILGPILGIIRDTTDSYPICLHSQTFLLMLCVFVWGIEYIIRYMKAKETDSDTDTSTA
ncbi:uncharacterized protein LOC109608948 isoform X2 [Aethina tumida]|uniref:uncharacterized protein LOC109608948 isoform X2 n=1 Tax=Aethina tumida TaxID=116153 RepID=UPI00096AE9E3|nr:uncharacterized protein LOC109608948 isoform X2 [Aethina tumida]